MSGYSGGISKTIESMDDMVGQFCEGYASLGGGLRMGIEAENFLLHRADHKAVVYEGRAGISGIFSALAKTGLHEKKENGNVIMLTGDGGRAVSLERGGQVELDGGPQDTVHALVTAMHREFGALMDVCDARGLMLLAAGFHPTYKTGDLPVMPKGRYPVLGANWNRSADPAAGFTMMSRTAGLQISFGWESEGDMVEQLRLISEVSPIIEAIYNNSPFSEGKPSGYQSARNANNDRIMGGKRYGAMVEPVFEKGFGFEKMINYCIDNFPMIGFYDDKGDFRDAKGGSFRDFMEGKLEAAPGRKATLSDLTDFINTIYFGARARSPSRGNGTIEYRKTDMVPLELADALPAIITGIMHDKQSREHAREVVKKLAKKNMRQFLRTEVPKSGLQTSFRAAAGKETLNDYARDLLPAIEGGLKRRGLGEEIYLEAPKAIIAGNRGQGRNWAQIQMERYEESGRDIHKVIDSMDQRKNPSVLCDPPPAPRSRIITIG